MNPTDDTSNNGSNESSTNGSSGSNFIDLHTRGIGYLNRVRDVPVRKGPGFTACTVAALHGSKDDIEKTYFDCRVSGKQAQERINMLREAVEADKRVLIGFTIGDIFTHTYTAKNEAGAEITRAIIKGRLLAIKWAKVDGEYVIEPDSKSESSDEPAAEQAANG